MGVLRTNENAAADKNFALEYIVAGESVISVSGMQLDAVQ
jgi:hypothetical protein